MAFPERSPHPASPDLFDNVCVPIRARLGHRAMTLWEVSALDTGHVIAFDKAAGEALDIMVGNVHLGSGEVVVLENRLAIRITELYV